MSEQQGIVNSPGLSQNPTKCRAQKSRGKGEGILIYSRNSYVVFFSETQILIHWILLGFFFSALLKPHLHIVSEIETTISLFVLTAAGKEAMEHLLWPLLALWFSGKVCLHVSPRRSPPDVYATHPGGRPFLGQRSLSNSRILGNHLNWEQRPMWFAVFCKFLLSEIKICNKFSGISGVQKMNQ